MAKITIEVDTTEATMSVIVNGEKLSNVKSVSLYKYDENSYYGEEKVEFSAMQYETDENNDVRKYIQTCAAQSHKGKEAIAKGAQKHKIAGLVSIDTDDPTFDDIHKYFNVGR